jgi:hypothetical protein
VGATLHQLQAEYFLEKARQGLDVIAAYGYVPDLCHGVSP